MRIYTDDVIKWNHIPRYWTFVRGIHRFPVNFPHKGQWHGALMFSLICVWINGCVDNREAGDLRRHRAHYDVIVMMVLFWYEQKLFLRLPYPLCPLSIYGWARSQPTNQDVTSFFSRCAILHRAHGQKTDPAYLPVPCWITRLVYDDVMKWKHFSRYWPFVRGIHRRPVNSPHKGQWRESLMFSLICASTNGWVNNRDAGDLGRHRARYDVTIMAHW